MCYSMGNFSLKQYSRVAVKLVTARPPHLPVLVASSSSSHNILRVVVVIMLKAKTELIVASDLCCLQDSLFYHMCNNEYHPYN